MVFLISFLLLPDKRQEEKPIVAWSYENFPAVIISLYLSMMIIKLPIYEKE
jgi:hypothetical protein